MFNRILFCCAIMVLMQLQGCMYQSLNSHDIKRGEMICQKLNSGVYHMSSNFIGDEFVTCTNGTGLMIWGREASKILEGK